jgi:glycosyltransferase involved in cell wall biosynthesis
MIRIGLYFFRRSLLARAARSERRVAHTSFFRFAEGLAALVNERLDGTQFRLWDGDGDPHDFLSQVDVVVGRPDLRLLRARNTRGHHVPYLAVVMGNATKGIPFPTEVLELFRSYDRIVCDCTADRNILRIFMSPPQPNSLAVAPLPIDLSSFIEAARHTDSTIRDKLGLTPEDHFILFSGRLTPQKNFHTLLPMMASLRARGVRAVLVAAGYADSTTPTASNSGSYLNYLDALVERYGLHECVRFVGPQPPDELPLWYSSASVVVTPTVMYDANFGLVAIESMASGTPAIVSDWGGLRDYVTDGITGYRMPTRLLDGGRAYVDWYAGLEAIAGLLTNPDRLAAMSTKAQESAAARYCLQSVATQYRDLALDAVRDLEAPGEWGLTEAGWVALANGWTASADSPTREQRDLSKAIKDPLPFYRTVYSCYASPPADGARDADSYIVYERLPIAISDGYAEVDDPIQIQVAVSPTVRTTLSSLRASPLVVRGDSDKASELLRLGELGVVGIHDGRADSIRVLDTEASL